MSWTSCMEKKIKDAYGNEVSTCLKDMKKGNLKEVAECIAKIAGKSVELVLVDLEKWSVECAI